MSVTGVVIMIMIMTTMMMMTLSMEDALIFNIYIKRIANFCGNFINTFHILAFALTFTSTVAFIIIILPSFPSLSLFLSPPFPPFCIVLGPINARSFSVTYLYLLYSMLTQMTMKYTIKGGREHAPIPKGESYS